MRSKLQSWVEAHRHKHPLLGDTEKESLYGYFKFRSKSNTELHVISSGAKSDRSKLTQWEHVSVSTNKRAPSWDEMCFIKNIFFDESETVVQFHPKKSSYINLAENCLHIWKPPYDLELPPSACV